MNSIIFDGERIPIVAIAQWLYLFKAGPATLYQNNFMQMDWKAYYGD